MSPSPDPAFWAGKRVFLTGHTGFKGSWLSLWLTRHGAHVTGYALEPPTDPSLFRLGRLEEVVESVHGDVRDASSLRSALVAARPQVVMHLAAQAIVRDAYRDPLETWGVNLTGTVNLLEAVRAAPSVRVVLVVTTDKVYENLEWEWGYRETDRLGGADPYSASKAAAELAVSSYRRSFFTAEGEPARPLLATARAGNVIGGGDWGRDRLVPDFIRALECSARLQVRNPGSVRPWQHVLVPLSGYIRLCECLWTGDSRFAAAWNFGPYEGEAWTVEQVVRRLCALWPGNPTYEVVTGASGKEAGLLRLDCSLASARLGWRATWGTETALCRTVEWHRAVSDGAGAREVCLRQIVEYESTG